MSDSDDQRERLSRRADVERDRLLRILDALLGRKPVEHLEHRAKQIGVPLAIAAGAGVIVTLVVVAKRERKRDGTVRSRLPAHLEIARNVAVSVATFALGALARRLLAGSLARQRR